MKILIINTYDKGGGAEQFAVDLLQNIPCQESCLVVKEKYTDNSKIIAIKRGIIGLCLNYLDRIIFRLLKRKFFCDWSVLFNINRTYQNLSKMSAYQQADVVVLNNIHGNFFDLKSLLKITKEKHVYWLLHDQWALTGGEAYIFENDNYTKGIAYTPYIKNYPLLNPFLDLRQKFMNRKKWIYQNLETTITFILLSKWMQACFEKAWVVKNLTLKTKVITNGADTSIFHDKRKRTWKKPRILLFNSSNPFKGSYLFWEIIDKIKPDFDIFLVGVNNTHPKVKAYFPHVENRKDLNSVYNQVDILIFPSLADNFPLTLLEALLCSVCVVGSQVGGIPEIVDKEIGVLFKNKDSSDLLKQLNQLLSLPIEEIRKKGQQGRDIALKLYDIKHVGQEYADLFVSDAQ